MLQGVSDHPAILIFALQLDHVEEEVGPVEPRHSHIRVVKTQHVYDVTPNLLGRRGGEGRNSRTIRQRPDEIPNAQIRRSEILTPLGYAVSFVHSQQGDPCTLSEFPESRGVQPLRRHVKNLAVPLGGLCHG